MCFKKKRSLWELLVAFVKWLGYIAFVAVVELVLAFFLLFF